MSAEWKCPKCGAAYYQHGPGRLEVCESALKGRACEGFICECSSPANGATDHGLTSANPCQEATCYCCGWGGQMPPPPRKVQPWEKEALKAGWTPPEGWAGGQDE